MNSKRKFEFSSSGDESENGSRNMGGVSTFNKYKSAKYVAPAPQAETVDSNSSVQREVSCGITTKSNNVAATSSRSPVQMEVVSTNTTSTTTTSTIINSAQHDKPDNIQKGNAQNKCGKSFAQTFSYLKNTDLYKLPPKPVAVEAKIPKNTNAIIVNSRQKGNPILKFIKNVPFEYGEIIPDYQIGERNCALFLSLRYHNLNPDYIHQRLKLLGNKFELRVILVLIDIENCKRNLKELGKIAILSGCTLILAWSAEEAGRYLETYKQYENKPPDVLQERVETDYFAKVQDVLTTIKSVNKPDVITLLSAFGSLRNIINASKEEISLCPGFGQQKAHRLYKVFHESFKRSTSDASPNEQSELSQICKLKRPKEASNSPQKSTKSSPTCKLKRPSQNDNSPQKLPTACQSKEVNTCVTPTKQVNPNKNCITPTKLSLPSPTIKKPLPSPSKSDVLIKDVQDDCPSVIGDQGNNSNDGTGNLNGRNNSSIEATLSEQLVDSPPCVRSTQPSGKSQLLNKCDSSIKHIQQSPKKTAPANTISYISKSEAVYNSGLSRNRRDAEKGQNINKEKAHNSKETLAVSSEVFQTSNTKSEIGRTSIMPSISSNTLWEKSVQMSSNDDSKIGKTLRHLSNTSINTLPKKPSTAVSSTSEIKKIGSSPEKITNNPVSTNTCRNAVPQRVDKTLGRNVSESTNEVSASFTTQLTTSEYEDLLASDSDDDDNIY